MLWRQRKISWSNDPKSTGVHPWVVFGNRTRTVTVTNDRYDTFDELSVTEKQDLWYKSCIGAGCTLSNGKPYCCGWPCRGSLSRPFSTAIGSIPFKPRLRSFQKHPKSSFLGSFHDLETTTWGLSRISPNHVFYFQFWKVSGCRGFHPKVQTSGEKPKVSESSKIIEKD